MIKINDKVTIDYYNLDFDGLLPELNFEGKDYSSYIWNNLDKEYRIAKIEEANNQHSERWYILNDDFLDKTSFMENELILVDD